MMNSSGFNQELTRQSYNVTIGLIFFPGTLHGLFELFLTVNDAIYAFYSLYIKLIFSSFQRQVGFWKPESLPDQRGKALSFFIL